MEGDGEENKEESQLLFAEDTMLVEDSKKLERLVEVFGWVCRRRKLKVNKAKSNVMPSARDGIVGEMNIMLDGLVLEKVEVFKFLGSLVRAVREVEADVQQGVLEGSKVLGAVRSILKSRTISWEMKKILYPQVIVPLVNYGIETWAL